MAFLIGVAFGFALERAGLGSAPKLAGQFYGTDFTVFKVMFSAIVTDLLCVYWLSRFGLVDLAHVAVPETWLVPQLAGGLLFGIGFVIAGLCPVTSCVAAATGRGDGVATMLGLFAGMLVMNVVLPANLDLTARGALTIPDALHVPYGVVVCAVVAIALLGFHVVERIEA
jgi:uncharacterized membrane protein YedE/YeeE